MATDAAIQFAAKTLQPVLEIAAAYPEMKKVIDARHEVLARYRPVFRPEHIEGLTADEFDSFVRFENNCHWTGLTRKTARVCDNLSRLKKALSVLLDEKVSPSQIVSTGFCPSGNPSSSRGLARL